MKKNFYKTAIFFVAVTVLLHCLVGLNAQTNDWQKSKGYTKYEKILLDQNKGHDRRVRAIKKINNNKLLLYFATFPGFETDVIRKAAAARISDTRYLYLLSLKSTNKEIKQSAILRLDDINYLNRIADSLWYDNYLNPLCHLKILLLDSIIVSKLGKIKLDYRKSTKSGIYNESTLMEYRKNQLSVISHKITVSLINAQGDTIYTDISGSYSLPYYVYSESNKNIINDAEIDFSKLCKFILKNFSENEYVDILINSKSSYLKSYTWKKIESFDVLFTDNQKHLAYIICNPQINSEIKIKAIERLKDIDIIRKIINDSHNIDGNIRSMIIERLEVILKQKE